MKQILRYILAAIIIVTFVMMVVSFFFTLPQPIVIADTAALILSIIGFLVLDNNGKDKGE